MTQNNTINIIGYHSTNAKNELSILDNGFKESVGKEHDKWLGKGVYFFCKGLPFDPIETAEKWAIAEAWDNKDKKYSFTEYVILQSDISLTEDKFLDLTSNDGLEIFNYIREQYIQKIKLSKKRFKHEPAYEPVDVKIIELAIEEKTIPEPQAIRNNLYIKFADERRLQLMFRTPNCTIIAVRDKKCIINTLTHKKSKIK